MPIYEYRCESCGKELDKIQGFSDPPLTTCPACGQEALKRLISMSSFHLKGSGWYVTDYKGAKGGSSGSHAEGKGAGESSSGEAKASDEASAASESKPSGEASAAPAASSPKPSATGSD